MAYMVPPCRLQGSRTPPPPIIKDSWFVIHIASEHGILMYQVWNIHTNHKKEFINLEIVSFSYFLCKTQLHVEEGSNEFSYTALVQRQNCRYWENTSDHFKKQIKATNLRLFDFKPCFSKVLFLHINFKKFRCWIIENQFWCLYSSIFHSIHSYTRVHKSNLAKLVERSPRTRGRAGVRIQAAKVLSRWNR